MDKDALKKKTVADLREEAKKIPDAKGISSMKKDDLIELILSGAAPATPAKKAAKEEPTAAGAVLDKADIKQRIRALKKQKSEALAQEDRKRARACNRQIHDYKRLLRKMTRANR